MCGACDEVFLCATNVISIKETPMRNVFNQAIKTYGQVSYDSAAEYATANDLLNLLFVGLTDSLIDAQRFLNEKRYFEKAQSVSKAQKILTVLRDTLDFEIGGDLADNLYALYTYALQRIAHAHVTNDVNAFREVHTLLSELGAAWQQASRSLR
jgi:flagellar protein FliS